MWLYRNGEYGSAHPVILFGYQKTRNTEHPARFLKGFAGTLVCDGYSAYSRLARDNPAIEVANCWAHARRHFINALKAVKDKKAASKTLAYKALRLIGRIYDEDKKDLKLSLEERTAYRHQKILPLVEALFAWIREHKDDVPAQTETGQGFTYCLNQETCLMTFLHNGLIPMDTSERAIRPFTVGRKNWVLIDTVHGAESSAMIYSLIETATAKANDLKSYDYLKYLLTEIPKHMDSTNLTFLEQFLPWPPAIPGGLQKTC